jgi:subfamily B ATP-binding cassette protein MsbA
MTVENTHHDGLATYRRLLGYVRPYWKIFLLAIAGMVLFSLTEMAFALIVQPIFDDGFVDKDPQVIARIPFAIIAIFFVRIIATFLSEYGMAWVARSVIRDMRSLLFGQLLHLPVTYYDTYSSGALMSKMVYDVEQLAEASSNVITVMIRGGLTILVLLGVMFYYSAFLTVVMLVTAPFLALLVMFVSRRFRKLSHRIQQSMGDVSSVTEETIEANREIRIFGGQAYEALQFEKVNHHNRRQFLKLFATNALSSPVVQFIVAIAIAVIIYLATNLDLKIGEFSAFMTAMMLLLQHARRLSGINATLQRGIAAAQSVFEFLDKETEHDTGSETLARATGAINYKNVTFRYHRASEAVLDDINLEIAPGETVAFVGRSGAGKTTLVNLLPRFYELSEGSIELDGHDIRALSLQSLRAQLALVSQHVTLFNDTIGHNIAYGALETANQDDIIKAAKAAHAYEFIEKLPDGFDTMVGENGVLLSGGQRQRLAIARAILKDAPVLILDEATSALDTESERYIQSALEELMHNRTTLVIAHRLSTIERADKIVVMSQGRIVEVGNHSELLAQDGDYAALHRMQFNETMA